MSREQPALRSDFTHWRRLTSRWSDNDVYGHINNTIFYQWFDSAVNGWLIEEGLLDVERGELIFLVVQTKCSYFSPLSFPEDVELGLVVLDVGRSSVRYKIAVFGTGEETCAALGEFVHVLVERQSRRPAQIPSTWRVKLEAISRRR